MPSVTPALPIFELLGKEMQKHFVANHASVAGDSEAIPNAALLDEIIDKRVSSNICLRYNPAS
jgi:hypothetical protein